jgi:hypothetical protein
MKRSNISFSTLTSVRVLDMPNLEHIAAQSICRTLPNLREVNWPNLYTIQAAIYFCDNASQLRRINIKKLSFVNTGTAAWGSQVNLIDIEYGASVNSNCSFLSNWVPTNALDPNIQTLLTDEDIAAGFTNNLEKLLYNIREHIAANLPDRTGLSALTMTFSAAVKAAILADQPTADAFTNKNWTIA